MAGISPPWAGEETPARGCIMVNLLEIGEPGDTCRARVATDLLVCEDSLISKPETWDSP